MTFFDQVHTTGMDISQPIDAQATVLLGKDMTFRDYAQACWRMRGLGRGQSVRVVVVRELETLVFGVSNSGDLRSDIVQWLLLNSIKSEHLQQMQLCHQDIAYTWRKFAFNQLQNLSKLNLELNIHTLKEAQESFDLVVPRPKFHEMDPGLDQKIVVEEKKGEEDGERGEGEKELLDLKKNLSCLSIFKESIDNSLPDHPPLQIGVTKRMAMMLEEFKEFVPIHQNIPEILSELEKFEQEASIMSQQMSEYDAEIVQEQEQQQQQEQQVAGAEDIEYSTEKTAISHWSIQSLYNSPPPSLSNPLSSSISSFKPLSKIFLWNMHRPLEKYSLSFPNNLFISQNHTPNHRSPLQRLLKGAYVVMVVVTSSNPSSPVSTVLLSLSEAEAVRVFLMREKMKNPFVFAKKEKKIFLYMVSIQPGKELIQGELLLSPSSPLDSSPSSLSLSFRYSSSMHKILQL